MKKWFVMLLALLLCMLMGTALAEYNITDDTLYVIGDLTELPPGEYSSIDVQYKATLELSHGKEVFQNVINRGTIKDGIFKGDVTNYHNINGGTFHGTVSNENHSTISGGTFYGKVENTESKITGGTFKAGSEVDNRDFGKIEDGVFYGTVFNGNTGLIGGKEAYINGGTFYESSEVTNGRKGNINGGTFYGKMYYFIPTKSRNGGTVIVRVDSKSVDRAMENQTVCLTVVPEANHELDTLTVTLEDDTPVALRKIGDFDYQFTMPANVVFVTAIFNECMQVPVLPETGDHSVPMLWLAMSILSVAGIVLLQKKAYGR